MTNEQEHADRLASILDQGKGADVHGFDEDLLNIADVLWESAPGQAAEGIRERVWARIAVETAGARRMRIGSRVAFVGAGMLVIAGLLAGLAALLVLPGGGTPSTVEALVIQSDGPPALTLLDSRGTEALPIEPDSFGALYLAWSPDGSTLAFVRDADIWLFDAKGEQRNLTETADRVEGFPRWASDGTQLAFASRERLPGERPNQLFSGPGSLTIMNADGSDYRAVGQGALLWPPSWSSDDSRLAYATNGTLHVYDIDAAETKSYGAADLGLPDGITYVDGARWSPERDEIVFYFSESDIEPTREQLLAGDAMPVAQGFAVSDLSSSAVLLMEYAAPFLPATPPEWSPDGERVLLNLTSSEKFANPTGLWLVDRAGRELRQVDGVIAYQALWSPAGSKIAYIDNDARRVVVLDSDTLEVVEKPGPERGVQGIAWRPAAN